MNSKVRQSVKSYALCEFYCRQRWERSKGIGE